MKSFLLAICLTLSPLSLTAGEEVFVVAERVSIYQSASYSSEIVATAEYGDSLTLLDEQNFNGFYFVSIDSLQLQGYIPADLVGSLVPDQDVVLSYNATLLEDAQVYSLTDDSVVCEIAKGARVCLYEGYDREKEFLNVSFVQNGKVVVGRISTDMINPDGVNAALIVSITAIVALVTIIIILFGITKKKQKRKQKDGTAS